MIRFLIALCLFSFISLGNAQASVIGDFQINCSAVDGGVGNLKGRMFRFAKAAAKVFICPTSFKDKPEKFDEGCITVKEFPYIKGKEAAKKFLKKNTATETIIGLYQKAVEKGFQIHKTAFVLALFDHVHKNYLQHIFLDPLLLKPGVGHSENQKTVKDPRTGAFLTFQFDGIFIPPTVDFAEFAPPIRALDPAAVAKILGIKEEEVRVGHIMRVASMFYEQEKNSTWENLANLSTLNDANGDFQTLLRKTPDAQKEARDQSLKRYLLHYTDALKKVHDKAERLERERLAWIENEKAEIARLKKAGKTEGLKEREETLLKKIGKGTAKAVGEGLAMAALGFFVEAVKEIPGAILR